MAFSPRIVYTVPKGWGNFEDLHGNFLLIPPGGDLAGVNPGTSDFIGVYSGIAAEAPHCTTQTPAPKVATNPVAIAAYWATLRSVKESKPRPVTVGGLHGVVVDLTPNPATKAATCTDPTSSYGYEPLIVGVGPADLDHGLIKGLHLRVYLLGYLASDIVLAIEVDDLHGGRLLPGYSRVVAGFKFS